MTKRGPVWIPSIRLHLELSKDTFRQKREVPSAGWFLRLRPRSEMQPLVTGCGADLITMHGVQHSVHKMHGLFAGEPARKFERFVN
jgi:hypothetical protein